MKTRGGKGSTKPAAEATEVSKTTAPKTQLSADSANPPQLFILPRDASKAARIVTLKNPRYQNDSRYLVCPEKGFYEFTRVSAPKTMPRSWLLSSAISDDGDHEDAKKSTDSMGYVTKESNLLIATSIDPLFIILPALCPIPGKKAEDSKLFLSRDDYLDKLSSVSPQVEGFLRVDRIKSLLQKRMAAVCDTVEAGDEIMFRLSEEALLRELLGKAQNMVKNGLPSSMEEKLVRKALESPIMLSLAREGSSIQEEENALGAETPDTQRTVSTTTSFSDASTPATSFSEDTVIAPSKPKSLPPISAPEGVAELLRLRTAFSYICSAYVSPHVAETLKKLLSAPSSKVNFGPLDDHLAHLAKIRQDAAAARSLGDFSRKRALEDDDEGEERRAEKRRREEEDKKKKANESRGVKALKKVNVTGMKKMSDFFKKK